MKKLRKGMLAATVCLSMTLTLFPMTTFADGPPDEKDGEPAVEEVQQEEPQIEVESIYLEATAPDQEKEENQNTELQQEEVSENTELQQEEVSQNAELQQEGENQNTELQQEEVSENTELQQEEESQQTEQLQEGKNEELKENASEGAKVEETEANEKENTEVLLNSGNENSENLFPVQEEEMEILAPGSGRNSSQSQYGNRYDHVDVKVDAKYNVKVDGVSYSLDGFLQPESIVVTVGTNIYAYDKYKVTQRLENGKYEYDISVTNLSPTSITWVDNGYSMSNVNVKARILLAEVPEALQTILSTVVVGNKTYYYTDFDMLYSGVQECTGGRGMRSEGKTGTPTGLDLYITKNVSDVIITKGKLGIEKLIIDEKGNAVKDNTAFTFYIKGNTVDYEKVVEVLGGKTTVLENLQAGSYTITEQQKEGYAIYSIDGNETSNYSLNYTVVVKEDGNIPVATFTNTKLSNKAAVTIQKKAEGLPEDASYPDPTIRIYAVDENGNKSEKPVWENTVSANGDTIYLNVYLETGKYVIEESGESISDYDCESMIYLNGDILSGNEFTVDKGGQKLAIDVFNNYSKTIIESDTDPEEKPDPVEKPKPQEPSKPQTTPDPEFVSDPEEELVTEPEPEKLSETPAASKEDAKEEIIVAVNENPSTEAAERAVLSNSGTEKAKAQTDTSPKTGEAEIMHVWTTILLLAGTAFAFAAYWNKKKKNR